MDFEVSKTELSSTQLIDRPAADLQDGQARLRVINFGFTANNITYAVFGDMMGYWQFFPASDGWGRIPVWGFAEVVDSNGTGLVEGEQVYGYLPMSDEWVATPRHLTPMSFTEASEHRADLPPAYNGYSRVAADPVHRDGNEALEMLLRPLFMTDFMLDDYLDDNGFFGASSVVLSSASSKTAFGLAHLLSSRRDGPEVVGLTSTGNIDFVEGLGVYDRVVDYGAVETLPADAATVYVDMAGNGGVRKAVHEQCADLKASVVVGGTHWEEVSLGGDPLPGPAPALFFAPDQIVKRYGDWGADEVNRRFAEAWNTYLAVAEGWIEVDERSGTDDVQTVYQSVLSGEASPSTAFVLSMQS